MIFDIILIIMLITAVTRASSKGCTEDLNFSIGFLIVVRFAAVFYYPVSKILSKFIENENFAIWGAYLVSILIIFLLYNSYVSVRIIEFGKKIPKTTGKLLTYLFAVFKTVILFSVIFATVNTLPFLKKFPDKFIAPKTYGLTYGIIGTGTEKLLKDVSDYLSTLNNPITHFEAQKAKQTQGSQKSINAVKSQEGLKDFIEETPEVPKKEEAK